MSEVIVKDYVDCFEALGVAAKAAEKAFTKIIDSLLVAYSRVVDRCSNRSLHLARYGHGRTKKKNMNRIKKQLRRCGIL